MYWSPPAVVSRSKLTIQFFFFECRLYLSPRFNKVFSVSEKVILVLFINLGWNEICCSGFIVYYCVNLVSFISSFFYFDLIIPFSFSSIVCWM